MQGARWAPGAIVGEYRLLERLGKGGMGAVDLALHLPTGARRAIKSLPTSADPELVLRFRREAEALARVDRHPGIVRVHAVGTAQDRHYLVMDHLPGGDLERRRQGGLLAPVEAVRLGVALARALAHAHARGVLHRDLKPSNVLFDEHGAPTLVDFGLARSVVDARALTVTGELLGTPAYMAPEQARGDTRSIDVRSDVYGLGAVLYHALCGRPPAEGRSALEVLARAEQGQHPRPRELRPDVPPALERVVERALARRPEDRFRSAEELARALEAALDDGSVRARWPLALAAAAVVAVGARVGWRPARPASPEVAAVASSDADAPPAATESPGRPSAAEARTTRRPRGQVTCVEDIGPPPAELPEWASGHRVLAAISDDVSLAGALIEHDPTQDHRSRILAAQICAREVREGGPSRAQAWVHLARVFRDGVGVVRSAAEAVRCLEEALKLGHPDAARELGKALCLGELDLAVDVDRGRDLLRQAAKAPDHTPGLTFEARRRARLDLGWVALANPGERTDQEALKVLTDVQHREAVIIRAGLLRRGAAPYDEPALIRALEETATDPLWGGEALRELVLHHRRAGREDLASGARANLERLAAADDEGGCYALAVLLLAESPAPVHRAAQLLVKAAGSVSLHARPALEELLRLCQREQAAGRTPPVALARLEELVGRGTSAGPPAQER